MTLTLGNTPQQLAVVLVRDADFVTTLTNAGGNWDAGISIELRFGATVWAAAITGADAKWNVDKVDVNTLIDARARGVLLFYVAGTVDLCWASGSVSVRG